MHLIDLAPFAPSTDPLLFTWDELRALDHTPAPPELRLVAPVGIAPAPRSYHGLPYEMQA